MVAGFIASLAALLAAIFSMASQDTAPAAEESRAVPAERQSLSEHVEQLRESIRAHVDRIVEDAKEHAAAAGQPAEPPVQPSGSLEPVEPQAQPPEPASPDAGATAPDAEGCTTEKGSGPGWARTLVRCIQQSVSSSGSSSSSSTSISSSSSVSVQETSSNDAP